MYSCTLYVYTEVTIDFFFMKTYFSKYLNLLYEITEFVHPLWTQIFYFLPYIIIYYIYDYDKFYKLIL